MVGRQNLLEEENNCKKYIKKFGNSKKIVILPKIKIILPIEEDLLNQLIRVEYENTQSQRPGVIEAILSW